MFTTTDPPVAQPDDFTTHRQASVTKGIYRAHAKPTKLSMKEIYEVMVSATAYPD